MSDTLALDPEKVSSLEPLETEPNSSRMLPGHALPDSIEINSDIDRRVACMEFRYPLDEVSGAMLPLDELDTPKIFVEYGNLSKKVMRLCFDVTVDREGLRRIAARLRARATRERTPIASQRLSLRLVSSLIDDLGDELMKPTTR